ncbi:MAG TPA: DUF1015 domain-containing protein [Thermomicrobiales bacterium]|nr:DUF1015 domain-containing protein [Thermomicrobiales bacterium]
MGLAETSSSLVPFRGVRFRAGLPGGLAATLGPPDDIDSSDEARAFVQGKPFNAVRLEIEDDSEPLRFQSARALLDRWRQDDVVGADPTPGYYVYEQAFSDHGERRIRRGIIGLVPLDAPDVCVLPHEETWEENRQRRYQLLCDLEAGISPVFLIYDGPETAQMLEAIVQRPPLAVAEDGIDGHRLWRVSEPDEVARIAASMREQHFIIADGHHRFAAAQRYHQERGTSESALVLACCIEAHDPGIVIRPFHRIVSLPGGCDVNEWLTTLAAWFDVEEAPVGNRSGQDLAASLPAGTLPAAGLILDGGLRFSTLRLRDWDAIESLIPAGVTGPARRLDVTILSELLIHQTLGISADAEPDRIDYTTDAAEAVAATQRDTGTIAILLRPIALQQVLAVARAHGTVPAKSTSFIPKVPIGLVLHEY